MQNIYGKEKNRQNRSVNAQRTDLAYGRVPPQAKEMEMAVLGACMLQNGVFDTLTEILKPECFYVEAHRKIYAAMQQLSAGFRPIDMLTVVEQLKKQGELEVSGGPYYVMTLTNSVVSAANIEAHARIILQKHMQRELIRIGAEMVNDAYEDTSDVFDCLDKAEAQLFNITTGHLKKDFQVMNTVYEKALAKILERMVNKQEITGIPSGFPSLDRITKGWQPTDLIILAARPSVGKTAFALNLARNAVINGIRTTKAAVFTLEMSTPQVVERMISAESGVKLDNLQRGRITEEELTALRKKCEIDAWLQNIFFDDKPALTTFELRAKARRLVHNHGVGLIIIDYLQLMSEPDIVKSGGLREQEISKISRDLKALAKELHIPVIALSQLSRDIEKRKESRGAQLSDLRESGAIEQDADMVMFLSRPDYQMESSEVDPSLRDSVDVKIAKHRNGDLATIPLNKDLSIQQFMDPMVTNDRFQRYQIEAPPPPPEEDDLPF
jgi:replicative DNA helicase